MLSGTCTSGPSRRRITGWLWILLQNPLTYRVKVLVRWLMALLNGALRNRMGKVGIKKDAKGRFYFKANTDTTARKWTNAGDREREVAAKKLSADGKSHFYVHAAAYIKFEKLGERFFVKIEPTYTFTEDGENPP